MPPFKIDRQTDHICIDLIDKYSPLSNRETSLTFTFGWIGADGHAGTFAMENASSRSTQKICRQTEWSPP